MKFFGRNTHFERSTEGQNLKIIHDTVKYTENEVFGVAQFVFKVISTGTPAKNGPQEAGT